MRFTRRTALAALAVAGPVLGGLSIARAAEPQPFTASAFEAAQKAGRPILIDTFATWCDVCARQKPILDKLLADPKYKDLVTFRVDFDTQKDVMRRFNARVQSTLIVYRDGKEVGRSVGETQPEWIDDLLAKSLEKGTS